MCKQCLLSENTERHRAKHPGVARKGKEDWNGLLGCFKGHKMLYQINVGEIVYIVGRLLQPFCSHAPYRVRVLELCSASNECFVIHGTLIDFKESPVKSYALPGKQLVRWESMDMQDDSDVQLSRAGIERVIRSQGYLAFFRDYSREGGIAIHVDVCLRLGRYITKKGTKAERIVRRGLGPLSRIEQMNEEDLVSLIKAKMSKELPGMARKVEEE